MKNTKPKYDLEVKRHSLEHVMVLATRRLFDENVKLGVGPIIADGFYQDFDHKISEEDFPKIESEMKRIINEDLPFEKELVDIDEAIKFFKGKKQKYKVELLTDIKEKGTTKMNSDQETAEIAKLTDAGKVSMYTVGIHKDLCRGPHVASTRALQGMAFKLDRVAGAYWRGSEKNQMLTRIYAVAFEDKKELKEHYRLIEEAKKRDHRKIGKEMGLFVFSDLVGAGLPLWTEKGSIIRRELERFIVDEEIKRGYKHVYTPDIANLDLYRTSGHYPYYKDSMYAPIKIDEEEYMLRPMTCPHHFELFKSTPRSYKELPLRIAELAKLYRYERSGELTGLIRVRSFCLADAHIVTAKSDAASEINGVLDLIEYVSKVFGLEPNKDYWYRLSLGDRNNKEKYFDDPESWEFAEATLREVLKSRDVRTVEAKDEAAFYGPKIDIQMKNVNGKEDTAFTCQYDFVMPQRFSLKFVNSKGEEEQPVVVHRSSVGAIERIIGFLIERFAGKFPVWLHPDQVGIIPVTDDQNTYAEEISAAIKAELPTARVKIYNESDTMQNKIRKAQTEKTPYMLIVGGREQDAGTVNVRLRTEEKLGEISIADFAQRLKSIVSEKSLEL